MAGYGAWKAQNPLRDSAVTATASEFESDGGSDDGRESGSVYFLPTEEDVRFAIEQAEEELRMCDAAVLTEQTRLQTSDIRIADLEATLSALHSARSSDAKVIEENSREIAELTAKLRGCRIDAADRTRLTRLDAELARARTKYTEIAEGRARLEASVRSLRTDNAGYQRELNGSKRALAKETTKGRALQTREQSLQLANSTLSQRYASGARIIASQAKALKETTAALTRERSAALQRVARVAVIEMCDAAGAYAHQWGDSRGSRQFIVSAVPRSRARAVGGTETWSLLRRVETRIAMARLIAELQARNRELMGGSGDSLQATRAVTVLLAAAQAQEKLLPILGKDIAKGGISVAAGVIADLMHRLSTPDAARVDCVEGGISGNDTTAPCDECSRTLSAINVLQSLSEEFGGTSATEILRSVRRPSGAAAASQAALAPATPLAPSEPSENRWATLLRTQQTAKQADSIDEVSSDDEVPLGPLARRGVPLGLPAPDARLRGSNAGEATATGAGQYRMTPQRLGAPPRRPGQTPIGTRSTLGGLPLTSASAGRPTPGTTS